MEILTNPDPRLRAPNLDVTQDWEELEPFVKNMLRLMYQSEGVGLAAPQIGWNIRLFVMNPDFRTNNRQAERVFWNPKITGIGEPKLMSEGCLSVPKVFGRLKRFPSVKLRALSPQGPTDEVLEGFSAQVVQHEVGHLEGKLCIDDFVAFHK